MSKGDKGYWASIDPNTRSQILAKNNANPYSSVALPIADHPVASVVVVDPMAVAMAAEEAVSDAEVSDEEEDEVVPPKAAHTPMPPNGFPSWRKRIDMSTGLRVRIMTTRRAMTNRTPLVKSLPRRIACLFHTMISSKPTKNASNSLPTLPIIRALSRNHRRL